MVKYNKADRVKGTKLTYDLPKNGVPETPIRKKSKNPRYNKNTNILEIHFKNFFLR